MGANILALQTDCMEASRFSFQTLQHHFNNSRGMTSTFLTWCFFIGNILYFYHNKKCFKCSEFFFKGIDLFAVILLTKKKQTVTRWTFMMKNINIYLYEHKQKAWSLNISTAAQWNSGLENSSRTSTCFKIRMKLKGNVSPRRRTARHHVGCEF